MNLVECCYVGDAPVQGKYPKHMDHVAFLIKLIKKRMFLILTHCPPGFALQ